MKKIQPWRLSGIFKNGAGVDVLDKSSLPELIQQNIEELRVFISDFDESLSEYGMKPAVLYGGVLRDTIAGRPIKDYDIKLDILSSAILRERVLADNVEQNMKDIVTGINFTLGGKKADVKEQRWNTQRQNRYAPVVPGDTIYYIETSIQGNLCDIRFDSCRTVKKQLRTANVRAALTHQRPAEVMACGGSDTISSIAMTADGVIYADKRFLSDLSNQLFRVDGGASDRANQRFDRLGDKYPKLRQVKGKKRAKTKIAMPLY